MPKHSIMNMLREREKNTVTRGDHQVRYPLFYLQIEKGKGQRQRCSGRVCSSCSTDDVRNR